MKNLYASQPPSWTSTSFASSSSSSRQANIAGSPTRRLSSVRKVPATKRRRSSPSSPTCAERLASLRNKSYSSSLSRFTLPDENGKRKIRNDIMSIAESLPALPGLYFDKKQKGFRVRYQNVYVGWVALSRFASIEEAYCSARDIWENAKAHAEKFQTPHAAVMASLPLQKEAQASGKNRGGRPRTVTQLPVNPTDWLSGAPAFATQTGWPGQTVDDGGQSMALSMASVNFRPLTADALADESPSHLWGPSGSLLTPSSTKATFADCGPGADEYARMAHQACGGLNLNDEDNGVFQNGVFQNGGDMVVRNDMVPRDMLSLISSTLEPMECSLPYTHGNAISLSKPVDITDGPPPVVMQYDYDE